MYCAPAREKRIIPTAGSFTCYTNDELRKLGKRAGIADTGNLSADRIWVSLKKELTNCVDEVCFADTLGEKDIGEKAFRPKALETMTTWLSNFDIEAIMDQYVETYPFFDFLGVVPIDFSILRGHNVREQYIIKQIKEGHKYCFGTIINLDRHDQSGSHWVALFVDARDARAPTIEYFDSTGRKPPERINKFIQNFKKVWQSLSGYESIRAFSNNRQLQFDNNSCGIYTVNYIVNRLQGISMHDYVYKGEGDKIMKAKREYYFQPKRVIDLRTDGGRGRKVDPRDRTAKFNGGRKKKTKVVRKVVK